MQPGTGSPSATINPRPNGGTGPSGVPKAQFDSTAILTHDTALVQHAVFTTPDRYHGYSADDNARPVMVVGENWRLLRDEGVLPLMQMYLAFLNHALDRETHRVRNFVSYGRRWLEEVGSEDSHGRTLWALGTVVASAPDDAILPFALPIFKEALRSCAELTPPRAWAFAILGCLAYLRRCGGHRQVQGRVDGLSSRLLELFVIRGADDWL